MFSDSHIDKQQSETGPDRLGACERHDLGLSIRGSLDGVLIAPRLGGLLRLERANENPEPLTACRLTRTLLEEPIQVASPDTHAAWPTRTAGQLVAVDPLSGLPG